MAAVLVLSAAAAQEPSNPEPAARAGFSSDVTTDVRPWTHLNFFNDPVNFQFAIISDNSGGTRPGVFADGIRKLNLLMPEFVMSVGDFIPGNTTDRAVLARDWAGIDRQVAPLKVPFFFVPGNHDINNDVMRDVWKKRFGVPFYSFVYRNVLFLALDSTGEKGRIIPDHQVESMRRALQEHADARWTFVFLHHPLWLYEDPAGFAKIEPLLEGRPHTVIAGHTHQYLYEHRNGSDYYILGTTGGGSALRGRRFGEFDHVTWVTMTDDGPVIANLMLSGILPHDATTRADYELTSALLSATQLPFSVLTDSDQSVRRASVDLILRNPSAHPLHVTAAFRHEHALRVTPSALDEIIAPRSEQTVRVTVTADTPIPTEAPALLELGWNMGYRFEDEEDLFLTGTRAIPVRPQQEALIATVCPEFVEQVQVHPVPVDAESVLRYTTDGTTPQRNSPIFDTPIMVRQATTLKVRRFRRDGVASATAVQTYRPVPRGTGLKYRYYEGAWTKMPDFERMTPKFESVMSDLNVESRQLRPDDWGMVLTGKMRIPKTGRYTFYLNSDDGSLLFIDGRLIIDNDGDHSELELSESVALTAGVHDLKLEYFDSLGEAILELDVEGPGLSRQPLPFDWISH